MAEEKMPITEHLSELRRRLFVSVGAVIIGFIVAFNFSENIYDLLILPLHTTITIKARPPYVFLAERAGALKELVFLAPTEAFWVHLKIALIAAVVAVSPVLFQQTWKFISPGLHPRERKFAVPFVLVTSGLFVAGTAFCFVIVLPFAIKFLLGYKTASLVPMLSVQKYVDFCLTSILAFGGVFELPVITVFLARLGVVTPKSLAKNRKYAVLLAFVGAAILTPPDAFTQVLMAGPIIVLYEAGILASRLFGRRKTESDTGQEP
ncbi:MAG: twin-arginine translocase subunit TatC [Nitrospirota bacterium]|jgi:sec-independent protein translocase protein TatC